jgi:Xaa-Pro aminopeptidase
VLRSVVWTRRKQRAGVGPPTLTAVPRSLASASMTAGAAALPELLQAQSVAILRKAADTVPRDIPLTTIVTRRPLRDALLEQIQTSKFDLLVMGAPVRGPLCGALPGVRRVLATPMFASAYYCREYEAELLVEALAPFAKGRIGLAGTYQLSAAILDYLRRELPDAQFVEASEIVDAVRMVKSAEEWELIERTAVLQDAAVDAAFDAVEPGKRDSEITAVAQRFILEGGGEQGLYLCASMPIGEPTLFQPRHFQNRVIRDGDYIALLVETNGPGGLWTELGRSCVVGSATPEMLEELDFVLKARRMCVEAMRPGVPAADVFEQYNAFMQDHGRPTEHRLHCHNQGYDLVERPLIRSDETATIEVDMNIACHPMYLGAGVFSTICDNYRIGHEGNERLHRYPEKIVEL